MNKTLFCFAIFYPITWAKAKYDRQSHLLNIKWSCPILLMEVYQWKLKSVASIVPSDCDETLTVSYNLQILNMGKAEL